MRTAEEAGVTFGTTAGTALGDSGRERVSVC